MRGNDPNPFDEEEPEVNPFSVTAFLSMRFLCFFKKKIYINLMLSLDLAIVTFIRLALSFFNAFVIFYRMLCGGIWNELFDLI